MPYPPSSPPVPYPPPTLAGPSSGLSYPPYLIKNPFDVSFSSPIEQDCKSPSDDEEDLHYPAINEFFMELETENDEHCFTDYTNAFRSNGYYRTDQLADESLTVDHMVKIIDHLKEGTARLIKNKALNKVKRIRKGKGKDKK